MIDLERQGKKNSLAWQQANNIFQNASTKVKGLDRSIKDLDSSLGLSQRNVGNYSSAFGKLGSIIPGLVAGFGVVGGIQLFTSTIKSAFDMVKNFDSAMAELAGVLETPKSELKDMRDLFLELGGSTAFTATEVAKASTELARLGFTNQKIKDSIQDVLNGTIAFQAELPAVAELAAGTLNAFGLEANQTGEVLNILAASANKTAAGFNDFVVALPKVSAPANALGISLERVSGMLGLLRDNSIAAESAGTGLRNIFLTSAKKGLDYKDALNQIATSQDQLATATKLFGKENATQALILANNIDKIDEYTQAVTGQGEALQFLVDQQMDTIAGSLKLLESAWEGFILSIESGDGVLASTFKNIIDGVAQLIVGITDVSKGVGEIFSIINDLFQSLGGDIDELNDKEFIPNVFTNLNLAIKSVQWLIDILKDLTQGVVENLKQSESFNEGISDIREAFDSLKLAFKPVIDLFKNSNVETGLLNATIKILSTNIKIVTKLFSYFANFITLTAFKTKALTNENKALSKGLENLAISITSPITAFKSLYDVGKATIEGLLDLAFNTGPKIGQYLKDAINPFATADASGIISDIKNTYKSVVDASAKAFDAKKLDNNLKKVNSTLKKNSDIMADILIKGIGNTLINATDDKNKTASLTTPDDDKKKKKGKTAKQLAEEQVKALQEELDFYIQSNQLKNKSDEESLKILNSIQSKKQGILDYQRSHNLISETKYQTELLKLLEDSNNAQIDFLKKSVQEKVDIITAQYDSGIIPVGDIIKAEKKASDDRNKILLDQYNKGLISLEEYTTSVLKETKSLNDKLKSLNDEEADRQFKAADLVLKNFRVNNQSRLEYAKVLNDELLALEKQRIEEELKLQKEALKKNLSIDEELLSKKRESREKLTDNEANYLLEVRKLNQEAYDNIKEIQENSLSSILEKLEEVREGNAEKLPILEQALFGEGGSQAFQELQPLIEDLSKQIATIGDIGEGSDEYNRLQTLITLRDEYTEALEKQRQKEVETALVRRAATLESLDDGKALIKQIIQTAVARAIERVISDSNIPPPYSIVIAAAAGIATNTLLNGLLNSISFEKGTPNAPFTGVARVDEKGPEIHTDRHGNIKSMGEKGGARFTHIEKGDKIFTASQSKRMREALGKQNGYSHLNFDTQPLIINNQSKIDYDKIEKGFLNALEKQESKKIKKSYIPNGEGGYTEIVDRKGFRNTISHCKKKEE